MTNLEGGPIDFAEAGPFIISNPGCHESILQILNQKAGIKLIL